MSIRQASASFPSRVNPHRSCAAAATLLLLQLGCERKAPDRSAGVSSSVVAARAPDELLPIGAALPAATAAAHTGETLRFAELRGKPVVVYFYPKDDTPGCTVEAQEIRDLWQEIGKTGAVVVGVSTDDDASHRAFADKHALPFLLLPDTDHRLAAAFGVPLNNGRARRVSFVFGRDGRLVRVFPSVKPQGHGRELLQALQALPT